MKFKPTEKYDNIYEIDYNSLKSQGINFIIFDIDNTLITYDEDVAPEKLKAKMKEIYALGLKACILSNGHSERAKKFSESLGMYFIGDAFKPSLKGYRKISADFGIKPTETVMIGDQIFTDIWGANRFGSKSILVRPIKTENEPGFVKFKRFFERIFFKAGR